MVDSISPQFANRYEQAIQLRDLTQAYLERHENDDSKFLDEFKRLPTYFKDRKTIATDHPVNAGKSRYKNIKAYDETRVKLSQIGGIRGSDYINANHVSGYKNKKQYICAQGPLDSTIDDFWRMVWEYQVECIVMLTRIVEGGKKKCAQYWPDYGKHTYGTISVMVAENESVVENEEYVIRRFILTMPLSGSKTVERQAELNVRQFHYLAWGDHSAPGDPKKLVKFIGKVQSAYKSSSGPLLVHCSAGVGRTGTFVALDILLEQLKKEGQVEVYNTVHNLRRFRNQLVQNPDQYIFIYRALMEVAKSKRLAVTSYVQKTVRKTVNKLK